jgi:hypothetical protein
VHWSFFFLLSALLGEAEAPFGQISAGEAIEDAKESAQFGGGGDRRHGGFQEAAFEKVFGCFDVFFVVVASLFENVVGLFFEHFALSIEFVGAKSVIEGVQSRDAGFESKAERFWTTECVSDVLVSAVLEKFEDVFLERR